jgi:hypothetical protein
MAPIVHGLEQQFEGQADVLYLDIQDERTEPARRRLGFKATPHFFLLDGTGAVIGEWQGVTDGPVLEGAIKGAVAP